MGWGEEHRPLSLVLRPEVARATEELTDAVDDFLASGTTGSRERLVEARQRLAVAKAAIPVVPARRGW